MRIIGGRLKRKSILVPRKTEVRPTTDRTRESMFNLVEARTELHDADVLDLFAGTGALGFEAVSRGARSALFIDSAPAIFKVLRENAVRLGIDDTCEFLRAEALSWLRRYADPPFDCIFADPPYDLDRLSELPALALKHVRPGGLLVLEHDRSVSFLNDPQIDVERAYGRAVVSIFVRA